jgi:DNA-binding LytR/AlgR family response regulator
VYEVALCEDEEVFASAHEKICHEILSKMKIEHNITIFKSGVEFLSYFESENKKFDLILLDIIMDGLSGMELAKAIRKSDSDTAIIFITSSRDYVFEGYDVGALHYLTKPVDKAVLKRLIRKNCDDKFKSTVLVLKSGELSHRISVGDIISLETIGRKVAITLKSKTFKWKGKLTDVLKMLPNAYFVRCHQSFAINILHVREITRFEAIFENGNKIPISRMYLKDVQNAFLHSMQNVNGSR